MATEPLGDANKAANQGGGGEQSKAGGPANFNASQVQDTINSLLAANMKVADSLNNIVARFEKAAEAAGRLAGETDKVGDKVKDAVNNQDRMLSLFKQSANLQKELNTNLKNQKLTWVELQQQAKRILDHNKAMLESGKLNVAQANSLKAAMKGVGSVFDQATKGAQSFGNNVKVDATAIKEFGRNLDDAVRGMNNLASGMGKVAQSRLEKQVRELGKAYRDAGNSNKLLNFMQDQYDKKAAKRELEQARTARAGESKAAHAARMKETIPKAFQKYFEPRKEGEIYSAKVQEKLPYEKWAKKMAYNQGQGVLGGLDVGVRSMALRGQAQQAAGQEPGWITKQAMKGAAAAGEGGSALGGLAEGGIGAGLGMAAMGYSVFKVLEKFIDTRAQVNQGVEKGLGAALFAPGVSGTDALRNVRENLRANVFNAYGQNLDRNLAIAQTMQEQGLDITELTKPGQGGRALPSGAQTDISGGFLGGTFGEFQRNAMVAGRGAGLTDTQTVVRMTKMIHEMRQTFEATHDFLENVNVQARAAGISTSKYLSIIDDLTSQFDKMNKSFNESVSIIQALGTSGANTAEDLTDMAKALTGAGENKTIEQNAAGFAFMSPSQRKAITASVQKSVNEAGADLDKALGKGTQHEVGTGGLDLNNPTDLMMLQNALPKDMDATQKQNIMKAAERKRMGLGQLSVAERVQKGDFAGAAIAMQALGEGAELKTGVQTSVLSKLLPGGSFSSLLRNPFQDISTAIMGAKPLGYKETDIQDSLKAIVALSGSFTPERQAELQRTGVGALSEAEKQKRLRQYFEYGKKAGIFNPKEVYNEKETLDAMKDNVKATQIIAQEIAEHPEENQEALHQEIKKGNKDVQDAQVKSVAIQTRTTADIYANAFEYLFTMIEKPIAFIQHLIEKIWPGHNEVKAQADTVSEYKQAGKNIEVAIANLTEKANSGDKKAQTDLEKLIAIQKEMQNDPGNVSDQDLRNNLNLAYQNSDDTVAKATKSMTDTLEQISPTASVDELVDKFPKADDVTKQAQALRALGGGEFQFSDAGNRVQLGKTLDDEQLKAYNATAAKQGLGYGFNEGGHTYVSVTMNTTEVQALMNSAPSAFPSMKVNGEAVKAGTGGHAGRSATARGLKEAQHAANMAVVGGIASAAGAVAP